LPAIDYLQFAAGITNVRWLRLLLRLKRIWMYNCMLRSCYHFTSGDASLVLDWGVGGQSRAHPAHLLQFSRITFFLQSTGVEVDLRVAWLAKLALNEILILY
jgi:hypothetical protein